MVTIDLFKYIVFIFIFVTLIGMGSLLANEDGTWETFIEEGQEDNIQANTQNNSIAMGDSSIVYNPQNENTQSEGLGGIGISQITLGTFKFFGNVFQNLGNLQAQAQAGQENTNPFRGMIWFAITTFIVALSVLLGIKVYQFWRFGN